MASRLARNAILRTSRVSLAGSRGQMVKRFQSTSHSSGSGSKKSSDTPWIIGSLVAFGPAFVYLVSPASRKTAPHNPKSHQPSQKSQPETGTMKDDEGTEVSAAEVAHSLRKAETSDVPKLADAEEPAEPPKEEQTDQTSSKDSEEPPKQTEAEDAPTTPTETAESKGEEPAPASGDQAKPESSVAEAGKAGEKSSENTGKPPSNMEQVATSPQVEPIEEKKASESDSS